MGKGDGEVEGDDGGALSQLSQDQRRQPRASLINPVGADLTEEDIDTFLDFHRADPTRVGPER